MLRQIVRRGHKGFGSDTPSTYFESSSATHYTLGGGAGTIIARMLHFTADQGGIPAPSKWDATNSRCYLIDVQSAGFLTINIITTGLSGGSASQVGAKNRPGHVDIVAATVTLGTNLRLYAQGVVSAMFTMAGNMNGGGPKFRAAGRADGTSGGRSEVYETACWTSALTYEEIRALRNDGKLPYEIRPDTLTHWHWYDGNKYMSFTGSTMTATGQPGQAQYAMNTRPVRCKIPATSLIKYLATVAQASIKTASTVPNASAKKIASVQNV